MSVIKPHFADHSLLVLGQGQHNYCKMVTIAAPFGHPNVSNETHRGHCSIDHYQQKDCSSHWAKSCADFAHLLWGCPIWIKKTALDCYSFFASRILQMDLPNVLRKCKRFHPVCSAAIVTSWPRFCTAAENLLHLLAYLRVIELWPALEFISTQNFSPSPMKVSKLNWLMLPLKILVMRLPNWLLIHEQNCNDW